jgi:hypothetical protein
MEEDEEVALAVDTTIAQVVSRASGDGDASGIVLGGHFVQGLPGTRAGGGGEDGGPCDSDAPGLATTAVGRGGLARLEARFFHSWAAVIRLREDSRGFGNFTLANGRRSAEVEMERETLKQLHVGFSCMYFNKHYRFSKPIKID